uniref:sensor histidine kinase n=1 Tax=Pseudonocardia pini TaxID=2758030 RepID=UPI0035E400F5
LLRLQAGGAGTPPELRAGLDLVIDELRGLVHGVMPAMLVEAGLEAAVEDLADRMPVPTTVDVDPGELPPVVQSTAYFFVAEALTNAVKHADASRLVVRARRRGDWLEVEVCDDGRGGARADGRGAGLRGARDRVESLGGVFELADLATGGTRLCGRLPCGS